MSPYKMLKDGNWPFPKPHVPTVPELFIIESLRDHDEDSGFFEGVRIAQILRLAGRKPKYFYVQDERELELLVPVFLQSGYRYLHMSCHGDKKGLELTSGYMKFARFSKMFGDSLKLRRLFVSACESGQEALVEALHRDSHGIQSVVAPCTAIDFDHAAAIWSAFYLSLLEMPKNGRTHIDVVKRISWLVKLFPLADIEGKIDMSFMFAGYASELDKGGAFSESWKIQKITKYHSIKPRKRKPPTLG